MSSPVLIIVMGASGCGKSSIGLAVAQGIKSPFIDADDLHPTSNVEKMASGHPLNDQDRLPWLHKIRSSALLITSDIGVKRLNERSHPTSNSKLPSINGNKDSDESIKLSREDLDLNFVLEKVHPGSLHPPSVNVTIDEGEEKVNRTALVVACSALKVSYRDILRGANGGEGEGLLDTYFIYLHGTRPLLLNRMNNRPGHFMKSDMLDSQLATLEVPIEEGKNKEVGVARVRLGQGIEDGEERGMEAVVRDAVEIAKSWIQ